MILFRMFAGYDVRIEKVIFPNEAKYCKPSLIWSRGGKITLLD